MRGRDNRMSKGAASGIVALVFLIFGFQLAVFVMKVVQRPSAVVQAEGPLTRDADVGDGGGTPESAREAAGDAVRSAPARQRGPAPQRSRLGGYSAPVSRPAAPRREFESFPFDPNTASVEDLQRLGLSPRQAEVIDNWRSKGGRFRKAADFARMYVVSDTLYQRLEPYIEIPALDLNTADSSALVGLRGIGPYYARKILEYRSRLGGFASPDQLLEIEGFGQERYDSLCDEIRADSSLIERIPLWNDTSGRLAAHPYFGPKAARGLERFKSLADSSSWTLENLVKENILKSEDLPKLYVYLQVTND